MSDKFPEKLADSLDFNSMISDVMGSMTERICVTCGRKWLCSHAWAQCHKCYTRMPFETLDKQSDEA